MWALWWLFGERDFLDIRVSLFHEENVQVVPGSISGKSVLETRGHLRVYTA